MIAASTSLGHFSVERYQALGDCGILSPDDRVELLDGLIVAMAPPSPPHDAEVNLAQYVLLGRLGLDVNIRVQASFRVGGTSVPQPDIALVPGRPTDYFGSIPDKASLILEVSLSSLMQDRLSKSAIYARAGVPCYWIVNLRDRCVEVYRDPDRWKSRYRSVTHATGSDPLVIDEFPGVRFEAGEFLPPPGTTGQSGYS